MDSLSCSEDLQCTPVSSNSELNVYKNTWSDGDTTYFLKEDTFIQSTANGEKVIAESVENFAKSDDMLMYWLKNKQVVIQQGLNEFISYATEYPIYTGEIVDEHFFIVTTNTRDNEFKILDGNNELKELFTFHLNSTENLYSLTITIESDNRFSLLLETGVNSGGAVSKVLRDVSFDLTENQNPPFTKLEFFDKESGAELFDIRHPLLHQGENGRSITFSAYMYDKYGVKVNKIFVGDYTPSQIEASAVTKKGDFFVNPTFITDETIAYFKLNGNDKELMYSSSTDEKLAKSGAILKGDFIEAFYSLISLLFIGIVLLLLSFTWIVPGLSVDYGTQAILYKFHSFSVSVYVNTIGLVITQIVLFSTILHPEKIVLKAPYLSEDWHVFLVVILAEVLCVLPVLLSRTKVSEDNFNTLILHTTGLNLFILFLIFGPYFI